MQKRYDVLDQNGDVLHSDESWALANVFLRSWRPPGSTLGRVRDNLECDACKGQGVIVRMHPRWGSSSCPEPEIETVCGVCGGRGTFAVEMY